MLRHLIIALLIISWSHSNSQMTILQEDFEVFPFEGWTDYQDNFGSNWQQCWQNDCGYNGGKSAHHYLCNDGCNKWLVTPQLNVSTSTTVFTFLERFDEFAVQYYEYSGVSISTGSGDPFDGDFVEIYTNDPADLPISWVERTLDLSSYVGQDVFIAFHFNGYWHEWFVDNVAFGPSTFVDAGITEFINPIGTSPDLGIQDIQLIIQNFGTETIQEYTIDWEVNGVVQTQFDQSSADLSPGQSSTVNIGQFDFDMEGDYEIMASLNVMDDFNPANNTLANLYYVTSEKDAAIVSIYPNGYLPDTGIHDVQVEIINEGGTTIQNVNIEWQVDGVDQIVYENGDLNLLSGESVIVTLGQYNFTEGIHELNADINASGEVNPENDIRVDYAAINTFWESFEGSQYPPEGWQTNWGLKETGFLPAPHGESYHFAGTDNNFFGVALDTLFTPVLEVEAGDQFSFYRKSSTFFPGTLNLVWKDAINNEVSVIQSNISSGNDNFNQVTIDIGSFAGLGKIGFAFSSGSYGEQSIDLITSDANIYQWPIDLSIKQYDSDYLARSGDSNLSTVRVKNLGQSTLSGSDYIVRLMTTNGIELTSLPGQDIEEYEELIFEFEYDFPSIGEYKVVAEVVIVGDEFASNNSTRPFRINSVPSDVILVDIGSPDYL
ncbi:MAG: hypothetical protein HKN45_02635, partial [Flavobacteriales bacterium]|nr:hypothetical protein [Flavobacteriales bacterium]